MPSTAAVEESKNHNSPNRPPQIILNHESSRKAGDNIFLKLIKGNKMGRFFLFMFLYFFVFKVIDYILLFFNVNREFIYTYFTWFSILFLFFVLLPLAKSKI